jgi:hypothetical protein
MLSFAVDPHQRPKDWHATLRTTRSDRSRQVTLGRWPDQPGSISRDVSVDNSVSWPNVGPTQVHPGWVKIHCDCRISRSTPMLILWSVWGSNPEPKD